MKRSREEIEEIEEIEIPSSDSSTSEISSSSELSSTSESESQYFEPNEIEKQVIRKTLAMICRSNMSDWDLDNSPTDADYMPLCELAQIYSGEDEITYQIVPQIFYRTNEVTCNIHYRANSPDLGFDFLEISWKPEGDILTIRRAEDINYMMFLTQTVSQRCDVYAWDCREFAWCYFQDARRHIERIRC